MVSQIFSEFIDATGRPYTFLPEWTRGWLVLNADPRELGDARLLRRGQPLELVVRKYQGRARLMAEWPLAAAGATHLEGYFPTQACREQHWVQPLKLSLDQVSLLLQELQWDIPAALLHSLHPQAAQAAAQAGDPAGQTTVAEERYRLLQMMGQLPALLRPLTARARYHLQPEQVWRPVARVRRPALQGRTLLQAVSSPTGWCPDQGAQLSWDTPIHRYVAGLCQEVRQRLQRLQTLRPQDAALKAARQALADAEPPWLATVPPGKLTPAALLPLRQDPLYQGFSILEQTLHQSWVLALPAEVADAPMAHLPLLYQWWGSLRIWQSLAAYLQAQGFISAGVVPLPRGLQPWPHGRPLLVATHGDGRCVRLMPEVTFTAQGLWRSMSYRQRPDMVVEISGAGAPRLLVLDPKYRLDSERQGGATTRPRKADLDRLHAYRDALRNAQGEAGVRCAVLLYPGETYRFSEGLLALQACPGESTLSAELTALWGQFI
jgi:hypothetical protein